MKSAKYPVEQVPLGSVRPHPRNYRAHPEAQRAHVKHSLEEFGFYRNIVIARDGTILAGHAVHEAATELQLATIPVLRLDLDPDEPRALKVLTGDNEMGGMADVDDRLLSELLREVKDKDDLLGTGFDATMLAALVMTTRPASEIQSEDAAAQWVGLPSFERAVKPMRLIMLFVDEATRQRFIDDVLKQPEFVHKLRDTWSTHWPPRPKRTAGTAYYEDEEAAAQAESALVADGEPEPSMLGAPVAPSCFQCGQPVGVTGWQAGGRVWCSRECEALTTQTVAGHA